MTGWFLAATATFAAKTLYLRSGPPWQPPMKPAHRPRTDGVLDFNIAFLNKIPILWSVLGAVLILGAIYYGARSSKIPSPVRSAEAAESAV